MKIRPLLLCLAVCVLSGIADGQTATVTNTNRNASPANAATVSTANATTTPSANANMNANMTANTTRKPRAPVFRATKDQITQAVAMLRTKSFYTGADTTKLTDEVRAALKKYQEAESMKPTGTLNKATLERMNIALTDKQKAM